MHAPANDLTHLRARIDRLRASNQRLREDLNAEFARFPRTDQRAAAGRTAVADPKVEDLTPRELEVLRMIAEGNSTKEVAQTLGISFKTAACHRHRLMQKLEVHTASSLVRVAIASGLVEV